MIRGATEPTEKLGGEKGSSLLLRLIEQVVALDYSCPRVSFTAFNHIHFRHNVMAEGKKNDL